MKVAEAQAQDWRAIAGPVATASAAPDLFAALLAANSAAPARAPAVPTVPAPGDLSRCPADDAPPVEELAADLPAPLGRRPVDPSAVAAQPEPSASLRWPTGRLSITVGTDAGALQAAGDGAILPALPVGPGASAPEGAAPAVARSEAAPPSPDTAAQPGDDIRPESHVSPSREAPKTPRVSLAPPAAADAAPPSRHEPEPAEEPKMPREAPAAADAAAPSQDDRPAETLAPAPALTVPAQEPGALATTAAPGRDTPAPTAPTPERVRILADRAGRAEDLPRAPSGMGPVHQGDRQAFVAAGKPEDVLPDTPAMPDETAPVREPGERPAAQREPVRPGPAARSGERAPDAALTAAPVPQSAPLRERPGPTMAERGPEPASEPKAQAVEPSAAAPRADFEAAPKRTGDLSPQPDRAPEPAEATVPRAPMAERPPAGVGTAALPPSGTDRADETQPSGPPEGLALGDPDWPIELQEHVLEAAEAGTSEIEIVLAPETLGRLRIRVEMREGAAQVSFVTETAEAARLLAGQEGRLSDLLEKQGLSLARHEAGQGDTGARRESPEQGPARRTFRPSPVLPEPAAPAAGLVNLIA